MKIVLLLAMLTLPTLALAQRSRLEATPHLRQEGFGPNGRYLPNDGAEYCVPTSFTMALYWLRANGLITIAPKLSATAALDTDLAVAGFYGTTPDGGTQGPSTNASRPKILDYLALRGIDNVEVERVTKPDYDAIVRSVSGNRIGVINIAWVNATTRKRTNGHDVTVVATGIDAAGNPAPTYVAINNPMAPATQFIPTETLYDFGPFSGYLAFVPGVLSKPGVIPVIAGVTILTPASFRSPITPYRPTANVPLAATGGRFSILAPILGDKGLTKSGAGTAILETSSRSTYRGRTRVLAGTLASRRVKGPAFGRGDIQLVGGSLVLAPRGSGRARPELGARGRTFSFRSGTLELQRGPRDSLRATVAGRLIRDGAGSLVIQPSRGLDELGQSESLFLAERVPADLVDRQGSVAPTILGRNRAGWGDFLAYDDTRGFHRDRNPDRIDQDTRIPANAPLTTRRLRIDRASLDGPGELRLSGPVAGLILNDARVQTARLFLEARETILFAGPGDNRISARIDGPGSLIVNGAGTVRSTGANAYAGPTTLNGGTLLVEPADGSATGRGRVLVGADATLRGRGRIDGDVRVEGNLQPGERTGRLRVGGNVLFAPNSTFTWQFPGRTETDPAQLEAGDVSFPGGANQFQILDLRFPAADSPNRRDAYWRQPHRWPLVRTRGRLNATGLAIQNPRFDAGRFSLAATADTLTLVFTPSAP